MDEQLGAAPQRGVGDRVHVADDHVRLVAGLDQRVGAAVDADQHRLEVADVRPHDPQVALVAGPAGDDERVPVAEARLQRREVDPLGEQAALPPSGAAACSRRTLDSDSVTRPRCSASARSSSRSSRARPRARHVPFRKTLAPRTVSGSPSATSSNSGAPGASISVTPPRTSSSGPGFGNRPESDSDDVDDDADARLEQLLGGDAVEVGVVDDRDVVLGPAGGRGASSAGRAVPGR